MVNENFEDVEPGQEGELIIRSPLVTQGYYDNPEATKNAFYGDWLLTGDIAVLRNGKFYVVDRKKVGKISKFLRVREVLADRHDRRSYSSTKVFKSHQPR